MQYQFTVRLAHFKTKAKDRTYIFAHTGLVDSTSIGLNWQKSCEERSQPSPLINIMTNGHRDCHLEN
jgi:hypothetical protein